MITIQLEHVSFSYNNGMVIKDINLSINKGELIGLIGPNGSGKTTLIKLTSGILHPSEGEILLDGSNIKNLKRKTVARRIAVVPQQFSIPFAFKVEEIVMLGRTPFLKMFSNEEEKEYRIVNQAIEAVGIKHLGKRFFNELSGGERQKVLLAMALAQQPQLLLLDEATAHLDISHQLEILQLVKDLNEEQDATVIAAIHDLNLASLYFKRLILLKEGYILADGTPQEVLTSSLINDVFSTPVQVNKHPAGVPHIIVLPPEKITN